jgi:hypothetical protein
MRIRYRTPGVELQSELVEELAAIYPEGRTGESWFRFDLIEDDPRLARILEWFDEHRIKPWSLGNRPRDRAAEYRLEHWRVYDPEDYVGVRHVRVVPQAKGNGLFRDDEGRIKVIEGGFPRRADIIRTPLSWLVVPERVKSAIVRELFRGVVFRPTVLVGGHPSLSEMKPIPWSRHGEPWWELTSDLVLPPMSPRMDLYDDQGEPVRNADCSRGCYAREGLYVHPEYRYREEDLGRIEHFDFTRTAEVFGRTGHVDTWRYIASARFREFCVGHNWRCDWIPVRIDD